jgi:hypothetical protein
MVSCSSLIRQMFAAEIAPCYGLRTRESLVILWADDWYMLKGPLRCGRWISNSHQHIESV